MTITALPTAPSRTQDQDTFDTNTDNFIAALPTFVTEANALAVAMNLNSTTDTSVSSVLIGTGAKTFTVTAGKSFQPGMWLSIADAAAPSTNSMLVQVTSYSGNTLVVNSVSALGSGTIASWVITLSAFGLSPAAAWKAINFVGGYTTTVTSATPIVLTSTSTYYQDLTGSTAQTITLPVVSTLTTGHSFLVDNDSTAITTINSSGGNLVVSIPAGSFAEIVCVLITGTTAASWSVRISAKINGDSTQAFSASNYTTAQGLSFPATQNPSADVNTLDDYEEGTWTPVVTFATPGDLSVAYTNQLGFYTKIGHRVFIDIYLVTSSFTHTTASGNFTITGLPFTASLSTNQGCDIIVNGITKAGYTSFGFRTTSATTSLILNTSGSGVALSTITTVDVPTGGGIQLRGQFSYLV